MKISIEKRLRFTEAQKEVCESIFGNLSELDATMTDSQIIVEGIEASYVTEVLPIIIDGEELETYHDYVTTITSDAFEGDKNFVTTSRRPITNKPGAYLVQAFIQRLVASRMHRASRASISAEDKAKIKAEKARIMSYRKAEKAKVVTVPPTAEEQKKIDEYQKARGKTLDIRG